MMRFCFPNERQTPYRHATELETHYATLCAFGQHLRTEGFFIPFYAATNHLQKTVCYRPFDKVLALLLAEMVGCQTIAGVNYTVKPDSALARAWGLVDCPDQSTISSTLDAFDTEAVETLEYLVTQQFVSRLQVEKNDLTFIDIDLSPIVVCGKQIEGAKKGDKAHAKNRRLRKVVRIFAPTTREIIYDWIVPGHFVAENVIKETIFQLESLLGLSQPEQRKRFVLRLDSGFGSDACINWLLSRGYQLLTKMKSGRRANKLAKAICKWSAAPSQNGITDRVMAKVLTPKRYCRKTKQLTLRFQKQDRSMSHHILVTTLIDWADLQVVFSYDQRVTIESSFSQDKSGLGLAKRKKKTMIAQQVLLLINQLAHNLIVWMKDWLLKPAEAHLAALDSPQVFGDLPLPEKAEQSLCDSDSIIPDSARVPMPDDLSAVFRFTRRLKRFGIVRFIGQGVKISGKVSFVGTKVTSIQLNPIHPHSLSIGTSLSTLLEKIKIPISLREI